MPDSHIVPPEPHFWWSLLIAVIGLALIGWTLRDVWRKRRGVDDPPEHHT